MRSQLVAVAVGALLMAGCSGPLGRDTPPQLSSPDAAAAAPSTADAPPIRPTGIEYDSIGAHSSLVPMGIQGRDGVPVVPPGKAGEVQVPDGDRPLQGGWISVAPDGPADFNRDPIVVLGHVNGGGHDGLFIKLKDSRPGEQVLITMSDGSIWTYTVDRVETHPKAHFLTSQVYGQTKRPEIRLITCTGDFDKSARSYKSNVIVFAHRVDPPPPSN